jgi:hypothetical protein
MDLTPPSLTTSPYSPQRKPLDSPPPYAYCMPGVSHITYPTLTSLDNQPYNIPPPYGSLIDPSLSDPQSVDGSAQLASLDSMASGGAWTGNPVTAAASPAASTTSSMPHVLASDYNEYTNYETSCIPASYASVAPYGRPASHSPAFLRTPPPTSTDLPGRDATTLVHRGSYGFPHDQVAQKQDMNETISYGAVPQASHFTPPPPQARHLASRAQFSSNGQVYLGDEFQAAIQASSPAPTQLQHPQPHLPSTPLPAQLSSQVSTPQLASSRMAQQEESKLRHPQWTRLKAPRKSRENRRTLTSKKDANYQCQEKGCGKYFSRSYNFKSHMQTHDQDREYRYPCEVPDCTKKFVRNTDLQRHHQSVHTKERNHKCDYCGRLFARKDTLRRHMEDGCSKRFEIGMLDTEDYATDLGSKKMPQSTKGNDVAMSVTLPPPMMNTSASAMMNGARVTPGLESWR